MQHSRSVIAVRSGSRDASSGSPTGVYTTSVMSPPSCLARRPRTLAGRLRRAVAAGLGSESAATLVEYALMLALIAVVCLIVIAGLGTRVQQKFDKVSTAFAPSDGGGGGGGGGGGAPGGKDPPPGCGEGQGNKGPM